MLLTGRIAGVRTKGGHRSDSFRLGLGASFLGDTGAGGHDGKVVSASKIWASSARHSTKSNHFDCFFC
jgi:hypothetical protein